MHLKSLYSPRSHFQTRPSGAYVVAVRQCLNAIDVVEGKPKSYPMHKQINHPWVYISMCASLGSAEFPCVRDWGSVTCERCLAWRGVTKVQAKAAVWGAEIKNIGDGDCSVKEET